MVQSNRDRLAAICGIAFAVLFTAGVMLPTRPGGGDSDTMITEYYADSGDRLTMIVAMFLLMLSGLALIGFLAELYRRLRAAEGEAGGLATTALVAGIVFITALYVASSAWGTVAGGIAFGGESQPGNEIPIWFAQFGYATLMIHGMYAMIVTIVITSLLARRTGVFPTWQAWTGFVCGALLVLSVGFLPMIALPVWTIATGVAMLRTPANQTQRATRPATATV